MDAPTVVLKPDVIPLRPFSVNNRERFPFFILFLKLNIFTMFVSRLLGDFVRRSDYKVFPIIIVMRPAASLKGC
ncbi:MAG: hypothetical protein ACJAWL_000959 [Motiliproteus sp.]|jgi:hypothetical protein